MYSTTKGLGGVPLLSFIRSSQAERIKNDRFIFMMKVIFCKMAKWQCFNISHVPSPRIQAVYGL